MKTITLTIAIILISLNCFGNEKSINDVPQTKTIVSIEYGVTCGKTGKAAVYVYHKQKTSKGFNVKTDREIVYVENLVNLRKTVQYMNYVKSVK